ncbi:integrase core domain-containing protein [Achromobacter aegrifaciens]
MGCRERYCDRLYPTRKPNQSAVIKRLSRTYRPEVLNAHLFVNLDQVQAITDRGLVDYNEYRPHESLGGLPPVRFIPRLTLAPIVYQRMST